jgi:FkbM family methyltransferase
MKQKIIYFDVGACIGETITPVLEKFNPLKIEYEIYAFEAFPKNVMQLRKKVKDPNLHIIECALGLNQNCYLFLSKNHLSHSIYSSKLNVDPLKSIKIPMIKFSDWGIQHPKLFTPETIRIMKLNIEGAEYDVIKELYNSGFYKQLTMITFGCSRHGRYPVDLDKVNLNDIQKQEIITILNQFEKEGVTICAIKDTGKKFTQALVTTICDFLQGRDSNV